MILKRLPLPKMPKLRGVEGDLRVARYIATRRGDAKRGPKIWLRSSDALFRLVEKGELVWVFGPRRHELAELDIDDSLPAGDAVVRDVAGVAASEYVRVAKPDLDTGHRSDRT